MQKVLFGCLLAVLVSLAGRFAVHGVILPPSKTLKLVWNYPNQSSNIVFNVYHSTDVTVPRYSWTLLTNVTGMSCVVSATDAKHFFTVTASNVVSRTESPR